MVPLSSILLDSRQDYRKYLWRKTNFLLTGNNPNGLHWLWHHLGRELQKDDITGDLSEAEWSQLDRLLCNFGYISPGDTDTNLRRLEHKVSWVFRHPHGGIFIPLELIKSLMQHREFYRRNYLFALLYRLKSKELRELASLIGNSNDAQLAISFEKNPLDMALVLYIYLGHRNRKLGNQDLNKNSGKILSINIKNEFGHTANSNNLNLIKSIQHEPAWNYLADHFPIYKDDLTKMRFLYEKANRPFFRSLGLVFSPSTEIMKVFTRGLIIPVFSTFKKRTNSNEINLITPREFLFTN